MASNVTFPLDTEYYEALKDIPPIEELAREFYAEYDVVPAQSWLDQLLGEYQVVVVSGGFQGDESKGKTVLSILNDDRVTYAGRVHSGQNAGHTGYLNGRKIVLHGVPMGVLSGKRSFIGPECDIDPLTLIEEELRPLKEAGVDADLVVGNFHVVTPYHKLQDLIKNHSNNASTLRGQAPVHASKAWKSSIRLDDLFGPEDDLAEKINEDMLMYRGMLKEFNITEFELLEMCLEINKTRGTKIPDHVIEFLETNDKTNYLVDLYKGKVVNNPDLPERGDPIHELQERLERGEHVAIELSQGFYLSNKVETFFRSTTSADVTAQGAIAAAGYNPQKYNTCVITVLKIPPSRVGKGANPVGLVPQTFFSENNIHSLDGLEGVCEDFDAIQRQFFDSIGPNGILEQTIYTDTDGKQYHIGADLAISSARQHDEKGATTQKPRVLGIFDCVAQHYVNQRQGPLLSVSCLDRGDEYEKMALVVGYAVHVPAGGIVDSKGTLYKTGDVIRIGDPMPNENVLKFCRPIIKVMDGWKDTPIAADYRSPEDPLPQTAQNSMGAIADLTGSEILSVGNGPETDNMIYVRRKETI